MQETVFSVRSSHEGSVSGYALMFTMVLACGAAVWIGAWLDDVFHTSPWCLLILLAYAIISSLYLMIRKLGDDHE